MAQPVISHVEGRDPGEKRPFAAGGNSFSVHEWRGSGPTSLHVHYQDDEAWHVLEGSMKIRFIDHQVEVGPGSTVFVPAGVAHTYEADDARYLITLPPRLVALIRALHEAPNSLSHAEIYREHESELLE